MGKPDPLNHTSPRDHHDLPRRTQKPAYSAPVVYSRDFAYEDNGPIVILPTRRMAGENITSASAKTFADWRRVEARTSDRWTMNKRHEAKNMHKRLLSGPTVDIDVGPSKRHWSIHQSLLCHHSSYFELEFLQREVPMKNGKQHLELLEDDPSGFELLVKWLYQGVLTPAFEIPSDEEKYTYAVACHKLWLLCSRFEMTRLKNLAMDVYRRCLYESQLVPDADEINEIYRRSPKGSPFQALMVNIAARQIMDPDVERDLEAYRGCFEENPDFAVELISAIRRLSGGVLFDDPTRGDACAYHDHDDVTGCPMQGKGKMRAKKTERDEGSKSTEEERITLGLVELSAEKRTPRKLRATPKPLEKSAGQRTPQSQSHRLNGPGSRVMPILSVPLDSQTIVDSMSRPATLVLGTPKESLTPNPDELSLLHTRSAERHSKTKTIAYESESLVKDNLPVTVIDHSTRFSQRPAQHRDGTSTPDYSSTLKEPTISSRKRKRTPRKIREKQPITIPTSGGSSRADSVVSGPRKLRVNSMVRRLESSGR
ncbi:hypothetical protein AC579_9733 [Pseudocercospora musae]|uniref:BTB domain-containing protein n=1 Tax=Pseudocercospora musae TaxID=113226 RepID=A0A139I5C0_9PEZI|nr:hypothetical protein AC579_9733 [Pseudocercospora musae]